MSGSIGGNRIPRANVKPTVNKYIKDVLSGFNGYKDCQISGSYNAGTRADHGDIDLVVWIEGSDIKKLKKDFKSYIENLSNEICPPFRSGKNQGKKAQMYGSIVTCQVPIVGKEEDYVQVDNIIVTTKDEAYFQKSFLDLDAQKQTLFTALVRVLDDNKKNEAFKHFGINDLPILKDDGSEEFEFVLSTAGLSLRKITLSSERKQVGKVEIWRSVIWDDVKWLLKGWDFNKTYDELLEITADKIKDERSRKRICGVMKSMINIGPGEVGTPKGDAKEKSIKDAYRILNVSEGFKSLRELIKESLGNKLIFI